MQEKPHGLRFDDITVKCRITFTPFKLRIVGLFDHGTVRQVWCAGCDFHHPCDECDECVRSECQKFKELAETDPFFISHLRSHL